MSDLVHHLRYFKSFEFDSPDKRNSGEKMSDSFLLMIDQARHISDVPFIITSGYRTREHNKFVGGSPTSSHMKGRAADIAYKNELEALKMITALTIVGIRRIGKGRDFIHCDNDEYKTLPAYWIYEY